MLVVNFKNYRSAMGEKAEKVTLKCIDAMEESDERVIVCPAFQDLKRLDKYEIEVFSQHLDPEKPGSHTGSIIAEGLKTAGVSGTLINHSERRDKPDNIEKSVERARENNLTSIVCAKTPEECGRLSRFGPDYIAFEPPELIGSDTSVSEAKPGLVEKAVERSEVPTLTGAGIKQRRDVEKSIEMGCEGVLVASGVVKAKDIREEVMELCRGL